MPEGACVYAYKDSLSDCLCCVFSIVPCVKRAAEVGEAAEVTEGDEEGGEWATVASTAGPSNIADVPDIGDEDEEDEVVPHLLNAFAAAMVQPFVENPELLSPSKSAMNNSLEFSPSRKLWSVDAQLKRNSPSLYDMGL